MTTESPEINISAASCLKARGLIYQCLEEDPSEKLLAILDANNFQNLDEDYYIINAKDELRATLGDINDR